MDAVRSMGSSRDDVLIRLVDMYQRPILHMCCMMLKDDKMAEDAVQETFLKAWKALDTYRGESAEKTWLMRIAINQCRDMLRRGWFRFVDRRVTPETLNVAHTESAIDDEREALAQAILRLPQRDREVILLYYYQNMNLTELAQTLGLVPSSVSHRLKKAREKLRALLERGDDHG